MAGTLKSLRFLSAILASWLIHLCLGTVYCWGNIAPYVTSYMRLLGHEVEYEQMTWTVSMATACQALSMFLFGNLHQRVAIRTVAFCGCLLTVGSMALTSITVQKGPKCFLVSYAGMFGIGVGMTYMAPIICLLKWLPHRKGLASGIVVSGFGCGAFLFNLIQHNWVNRSGLIPTIHEESGVYFDWKEDTVVSGVLNQVPSLFVLQSLIFATSQILGVVFLVEPLPTDTAPTIEKIASSEDLLLGKFEYTTTEMLQTKQFWWMLINISLNSQVVLFIATSSKTLGEVLVPNISDGSLTLIIGVAALFNGIGRIIWGLFGDATTFRAAMTLVCMIQAVILTLLPKCTQESSFAVMMCSMFFCVGGNFALFPLGVCTYFGPQNLGSNYGTLFCGLAVSELAGSLVMQLMFKELPVAVQCRLLSVVILISGFVPVLLGSAGSMTVAKANMELKHSRFDEEADTNYAKYGATFDNIANY